MKIREGRREDASFLARTVIEAIGPELCESLAGGKERVPLAYELFTALAARSDSQYSYRNALVAESETGDIVGAVIVYDGASLHMLRRAFAQEANRILGWNVSEEEADNWDDEADPGEIYIDSLYVIPQSRKRGIASALLDVVKVKYKNCGKPLGLLVEPTNRDALQTYVHWGFKEVGVSNFFHTPMIHMELR